MAKRRPLSSPLRRLENPCRGDLVGTSVTIDWYHFGARSAYRQPTSAQVTVTRAMRLRAARLRRNERSNVGSGIDGLTFALR